MAAIIELLGVVLARIGQVLGIAQQILGFTTESAQEHIPYNIESIVTAISLNIANPTYGLAALQAHLSNIDSEMGDYYALLSSQLSTTQQAGSPVTLPSSPPTGYGGGASALEVWTYPIPSSNDTLAADVLAQAGNFGLVMGLMQTLVPYSGAAGILVYDNWQEFPIQPPVSVPSADTSTILSTDATLTDWWNRVNPDYPVQFLDGLGRPVFYSTTPGDGTFYVVDIPAWLFPYIRDGFGGTSGNLAPIWPGEANVTYHDDTPVVNPLTVIDVAMDGLEWGFDTVAAKAAYYDFGHRKSFKSLGLVAFYNDDDQTYEPAQPIGFQQGLIVPKTMKRAAGVSILLFQECSGFYYPVDFAT